MARNTIVNDLFHSYWKLMTPGIPSDTRQKWEAIVSAKYREPQRYYHTLQHVLEMKKLSDTFASQLINQYLVDYAIVFHDVIYDPKSGDNEEKSAELFIDFAKDINLTREQQNQVYDWIMLTKHHTTTEHGDSRPNQIEDKHFFLDFDMAILGAPVEDYKDYAEKIRKEYCHIEQKEYCMGRSKVLTTFLEAPRIYATNQCYDLYEVQARQNIAQEIKALQNAETG